MRRAKPKSDKTYVDYVELQTGTKETARKKRHERNGCLCVLSSFVKS
jgi:hypothetical protein